MVYAYDTPVQLPVMDLYDTLLMSMAVNVAKDMYDRGLQLIKEFNEQYGNFFTPIDADQDWYNENVINKVRNQINSLYEQGIDPLRSAEGRAFVSRLVNSIDVGSVNRLRQSKAAAEEYIKNRSALDAQGLYSKDLELFQGRDLSSWDTIGGGKVWEYTSPTRLKSLLEITEDQYKEMTPRDLSREDMIGGGYDYDPRYQYQGILYNDLLNTAERISPSIVGNVFADFYRDWARRKVEAAGIEATPEAVERQFRYDIANANIGHKKDPVKKADEYALDKARTANDVWAHAANAATDYHYDLLLLQEKAKLAETNKQSSEYNVFDNAYNNPGQPISFSLEGDKDNYITPKSAQIQRAKSEGGTLLYKIPGSVIKGQLFTEHSVHNKNRGLYYYTKNKNVSFDKEKDYIFEPNGTLTCKMTSNGPRYFISGRILGNGDDYLTHKDGSIVTFELEVKPLKYNYGKKNTNTKTSDTDPNV